MNQTFKAEETFIKAEADSASLEEVLNGKDSALSVAELRALEEKAETAVTDLQTALKEIVNSEQNLLDIMNEIAFGNKNYNTLLVDSPHAALQSPASHHGEKRGLREPALPPDVVLDGTPRQRQETPGLSL